MKDNAVRIRTFNEVIAAAKSLPEARNLWYNFIFENEIAILVGGNGVGKSIIAVDIAIDLATGIGREDGFTKNMPPKKVVYVDYELTDRQFYRRFPTENFPDNLFRVDLNPESECAAISTKEIEKLITQLNPEVLIIDNLTTLIGDSAQDADVAIRIMKWFKELQRRTGLTIIILAHTPKLYFEQPLKVDHVGGSKHITNYADSVFFIAKSSVSTSCRYIKHVKMRNTEDTGLVYQFELDKKNDRLHFFYIGMNEESNHFESSPNRFSGRNHQMYELRNQGKTYDQIGEILGVNKSTVSRFFKRETSN